MDDQTTKAYYKIGEVAELLELPQSTLRFWETEFSNFIKPKRNAKGTRYYSPKTIENIRIVKHLIKDRGLKLDAVKAEIKNNPSGTLRRTEAIVRLKEVRDQLVSLIDSLHKLR